MQHVFQLACRAATEAAALLRKDFVWDAGVTSSSDKDIKTLADLAAQKLIVETLAESGVPVVAEEGEHAVKIPAGPVWIVDPLDGTLNFTRGFPMAAVSVALWDDGKPCLGAVADVFRCELYSGYVGSGAWFNQEPMHVSSMSDSAQAVIATGFPSGRSYEEASLLEFVAKVRRFKKVRMLGSAALMLAQVAAGRFDVYEEEDIYFWDVAAGLALVRAAGGNFRIEPGSTELKYRVLAWNGKLSV
jgi:myo-inositol-1(or 4)-monophosphatase